MGQQQMLLIILGVILIGVAIAVGLPLFGSGSVSSNKDAIVNDFANIAADAYQYRLRIRSMGGGGFSYVGYKIPPKLQSNEDGTFSASVSTQSITLTGTSSQGYGAVQATLDSMGVLTDFSFTGDFQ